MMKIKAKEQDRNKMKAVGEEPIPTLYCDGFQGITFSQNVVKINLVEERMPADEGALYRYLTARLVMPTEVFMSFVDVLSKVKQEAISKMGEAQKDEKAPDTHKAQ